MEDHYLKKELYDLVKHDSIIFEFIQKGSLDGMWYWDLEKPKDEWLSPGFWELLGYDPADKKHHASEWQDLIQPEDLKTALENFEKHCADPNHPYDQVVRYRHKDGSTIWVRCRGIAIHDDAGKPIRMLGAHTDITALKEAEQELKNRNEALSNALAELRVLRGIIPICSHCHNIRDDKGFWERVETYISNNTEAKFSHGICPDCLQKFYPEFASKGSEQT